VILSLYTPLDHAILCRRDIDSPSQTRCQVVIWCWQGMRNRIYALPSSVRRSKTCLQDTRNNLLLGSHPYLDCIHTNPQPVGYASFLDMVSKASSTRGERDLVHIVVVQL